MDADELLDIIRGRVKLASKDLPEDPTEELEVFGDKDEEPKARVEGQPGQVTRQNLFRHPDAHPIALDLSLLQKYGVEWLTWEPETLEAHINRDFGGSSDINLQKVMACKTLHLVDTFWERWEVFSWCTVALNGMFPDFDIMQAPTAMDISIAVDISNRIRDDVPWSSEVEEFARQSVKFDGLLVVSSPISFAQPDVEGFPLDVEDIKKRWPGVKASGQEPSEDSVEGEQLRRMLRVEKALDHSRLLLRSQLPLVGHGLHHFGRT